MYTLTDVTKNYPKGRSTVVALRGLNLVIDDRPGPPGCSPGGSTCTPSMA